MLQCIVVNSADRPIFEMMKISKESLSSNYSKFHIRKGSRMLQQAQSPVLFAQRHYEALKIDNNIMRRPLMPHD